MHWAAKYIGRPWQPGGCWLLVQEVFRERFGVEMPDVFKGASALRSAARVSGWRPANGEAQENDIVVMAGIDGQTHVGVMVRSAKGLRLLHADGHLTPKGPVGSVVAVPLKEAAADGYGNFEIWRRA